MAKITAVYGPMFAGKTTWILQKIEELEKEGNKCLVFKPRLDDRYGKEPQLYSHDGANRSAILVDEHNPQRMLEEWASLGEQHRVVIIDEAMFFSPAIVEVVREMVARDLHVIVAGLDTNYRKEPFEPMPKLIKMADEQRPLYAKCYLCGAPASYSARLAGGEDSIVVGGSDSYQPACAKCHTMYHENGIQRLQIQFPMGRKRVKSKWPRIEVMADSMRVGKTTAVKAIAEGLRELGHSVYESYEDWQNNPYLKKSYSDPAKNFLDSQKWFIKRKYEQVVVGSNNGLYIQDVSPEMDFCYALTNRRLGRMSDEHFLQYQTYYYSLDWDQAPAPDVLVYLSASDDVLLQRAMDSRREFESVEPEYFLMMKRVNREWLEHAKSVKEYRILNIETDRLDFAHDEAAKRELVVRVVDELELG